MLQYTPIVETITGGIVLAFILGAAANRLRLPTTIGYLVAGIIVGPFTPGIVADQWIASQLAEIGVILLMFGVGLHFSVKDLLVVRNIAVPGALAQMAVATLVGTGLGVLYGWPVSAGVVYGLALAVASTVVLVRALQEHRLVDTARGRIALGWLVVQDLVMVLALVFLPVMGGAGEESAAVSSRSLIAELAQTLAEVVAFVAIMMVIGRRLIPWILHYVAHTGSRELFRLAVLAVALGVAYGASKVFGISFALGAFFAGMIMHESPLSQRAAEESLPLRDAFAVLFFVSVGMLFDPSIVVRDPLQLIGTLFVVLVCSPAVAFGVATLFGQSKATAYSLAISIAQIGEFSFILAGLGIALEILPVEGRDLILAGALISIFVNPILFGAFERWGRTLPSPAPAAPDEPVEPEILPVSGLADHAVIVGYGRVGRVVAEGLLRDGNSFLVIEERKEEADRLRKSGIEVIQGNGVNADVLNAANLIAARWLFVAIPDGFEAGQVVEQARKINAELPIVARAHSDAEVEHLMAHGASFTIMGEREIGLGMLEYAYGRASGSPTDVAASGDAPQLKSI
ncbi:MAG TPA: YbaL family putative K(+) efflux transporter [Xanthobacteraceae bacterium]|nr:YbaL family putative K(+) efflux transporter [Xanthobacteraceae bacterium]